MHPCFLLRPIDPYPGKHPDLKSCHTCICLSKRTFCLFCHTEFLMVFSACPQWFFLRIFFSFQTHWFAHMRQTRVNAQSFFITPSFARLLILYSERLFCFCPLLILTHAEFQFRSIGLFPGSNCISPKIFRASHLRCAPVTVIMTLLSSL